MDSNESLINLLKESGYLNTPEIIEALKQADRIDFVPDRLRDQAYANSPLPIGKGQTISQPLTVVFMLELLEVEKGQKVLDIGAGSGWTSALLSELVGPEGRVYAYEIVPSVGEFGKGNVEGIENVTYKIQDFMGDFEEKAPYDRILSGAAFEEIPKPLLESLSDGGILAAPTKRNDIRKIVRAGEEFTETTYPGFVFVPITGEAG